MAKLVNIYIDGNFDEGFSVRAEIREDNARSPVASERAIAQRTGRLPAAPHLRKQIGDWQKIYQKVVKKEFALKRQASVTNSRDEEKAKKKAGDDCRKVTADLKSSLNGWLEDREFRPIDSLLRNHLKADEEIRVLLETDNHWLRKLPWQEWTLIRDFPEAEVALSSPKFKGVKQVADSESKQKTKILIILGDYNKNNEEAEAIEKQVQEIEELAQKINAEVTWLHQPQRRDLDEPLWRQEWDILFYAGHGETSDEGQVGKILINKEDWLKVSDIKNHLKRAIDYGLKLAIFNACRGLGLAYQLADGENLHLPQVIVMRDLLPVPLAPLFLRYFLEEFTQGKSLYAAVRDARRRLQIFEDEFPCASWLPVICQNPAETSLTWQMLGGIPPCPYRGLRAFGEEHAPFFFGREAFTELLGPAVRRKSLVAVIGASGSGKSSVVFAGLIPGLREKGIWHVVSFRPGKGPFANLAAALLPLTGDGTEDGDGGNESEIRQLADDLQQGVGALKDVVESIVRPDSRRLLLVADQFEELYTLCPDEEKQRYFLDCLLKAVKDAACFTLLITLRADFYGYAMSYRPFADALQGACHNLGPMKREELSDAIVLPAEKLNVLLEEGLQERLINELDVAGNNLPLLAFTLEQLWYKQKSGLLTSRAYDEIGGVTESLGNHAENVYKHLSEPDRDRARRVFVQLIQPGEGTQDTRRLASRADVGAENWDLVTRLASQEARLVVTDRNQVSGEETVEIVHEALIGGWDRLDKWMKGDREFRSWQEGLRAKMREWEEKENDEGILLRGVPLGEAEGWLQERNEEIAPAERVFVQFSLELRDREKQQRKRLQRRIIGGLTAGLAVASSLAGIATWQWMRAVIKETNATLRVLNTTSENLLNSNRGLDALMKSLEAGRLLQRSKLVPIDTDTRIQVLTALQQATHEVRERIRWEGHSDRIVQVKFSPDGQTIASSSADGTIKLWSRDGTLIKSIPNQNPVWAIDFSSDGQTVASAIAPEHEKDSEGIIKLWNLDGELIKSFKGHDGPIRSLKFSPDSKMIASAGTDESAKLWTLDGNLLHTMIHNRVLGNDWLSRIIINQEGRDPLNQVSDISFSPDGQTIATAHWGGKIYLWSLEGELLQTIPHESAISVIFSPDGQIVASGNSRGVIKLWSRDGNLLQILEHNSAAVNEIVSLRFSPDSQVIATAAEDGSVKLWSRNGTLLETFQGHDGPASYVSFSYDGKTLVSSGYDNTIRIWSFNRPLFPVIQGHNNRVEHINFSPDDRIIATSSRDQTIKLWSHNGILLSILQKSEIPYVYNRVSEAMRPNMGAVIPPPSQVVNFSPDSNIIATSDWSDIKFWSRDGKYLATLNGGSVCGDVEFNTDGHSVAWTSHSHNETSPLIDTVIVRSIEGRQIAILEGHRGIEGVSFSPDKKMIATLDRDRIVKIWNLDGTLLKTFSPHRSTTSINFSPKGKIIATSGRDGKIKLWSLDGQLLQTIEHGDTVLDASFSPDGQMIVSGGSDSTIKLWSLNGREIKTIKGHNDLISSVSFSPDGKIIASGGHDNTIKLWSLNGREIKTIQGHDGIVSKVRFSPDGQTIVSSSYDNTVKLWSLDGRLLKTIQNSGACHSVAFSPDGQMIVAAGDRVTLWSREGKQLKVLNGHVGYVSNLIFSKDSKKIISVDNIEVKLWNIDGTLEKTIRLSRKDRRKYNQEDNIGIKTTLHSEYVKDFSISPDLEIMASASYDGTVKLWEQDGTLIATLQHNATVTAVTFSPNGQILASASEDKTVKLWSREGKELRTLRGHSASISDVIFSPDGKLIATASYDKTVKLWTLEGQLIKKLQHSQVITGLSFSSDGKTLAAGTSDGTVFLWNLDLNSLLAYACNWVDDYLRNPHANLSQDERNLCNGISTLVPEGEELARIGNIDGAILKFREALRQNPRLQFDPERKARFLAAPAKLEEGIKLAREDKIEQAISAYAEVQKLNPAIISAESWNALCWNGSLYNHAAEVIDYCEKAVELQPESGYWWDSRGLARALTGDTEGAIDDFQAFIDWIDNTDPQTEDQKVQFEKWKLRRQGWIDALRAGENPFTEEVLNSLLSE